MHGTQQVWYALATNGMYMAVNTQGGFNGRFIAVPRRVVARQAHQRSACCRCATVSPMPICSLGLGLWVALRASWPAVQQRIHQLCLRRLLALPVL